MTAGRVNDSGRRSIGGTGIGLRSQHYVQIREQRPQINWFEALVNNYMGDGGFSLWQLEQIRSDYPITFHGVGISLGSTDPLSEDYLKRLQERINRFEPAWVSEHLCWSSVGGHNSHDLLPLPYTEESLRHVTERITKAQERLGTQILVENVSSYLSFRSSEISEWDFLATVAEVADCRILIDVNNIYVSARNHGFDPLDYLKAIPRTRVSEIHLAGYEHQGTHLLDTHGAAVHPPVWDLYRDALRYLGPVPTLIEWDTQIPELDVLLGEVSKADRMRRESLSGSDAA